MVALNITALLGEQVQQTKDLQEEMVLTIIHILLVVEEVQALWELTGIATNQELVALVWLFL